MKISKSQLERLNNNPYFTLRVLELAIAECSDLEAKKRLAKATKAALAKPAKKQRKSK